MYSNLSLALLAKVAVLALLQLRVMRTWKISKDVDIKIIT